MSELSDEASESEQLGSSLSLWLGDSLVQAEELDVPLDLHTACSIGQYDVVAECIQKWVILSQTSFIPFCIHFIHSMSVVFFRPEVDLDGINKGGWTPLMYASYIGHDNIANLLLEAGVNVNASTAKGVTPLMLAASCGNESIAYFLLQVPNKLMLYSVGVFTNLRGKCFSSLKSHILHHWSRETVSVSLIKLFFSYSNSKVLIWSWKTAEDGLLCFTAQVRAISKWSGSFWIAMLMPM